MNLCQNIFRIQTKYILRKAETFNSRELFLSYFDLWNYFRESWWKWAVALLEGTDRAAVSNKSSLGLLTVFLVWNHIPVTCQQLVLTHRAFLHQSLQAELHTRNFSPLPLVQPRSQQCTVDWLGHNQHRQQPHGDASQNPSSTETGSAPTALRGQGRTVQHNILVWHRNITASAEATDGVNVRENQRAFLPEKLFWKSKGYQCGFVVKTVASSSLCRGRWARVPWGSIAKPVSISAAAHIGGCTTVLLPLYVLSAEVHSPAVHWHIALPPPELQWEQSTTGTETLQCSAQQCGTPHSTGRELLAQKESHRVSFFFFFS